MLFVGFSLKLLESYFQDILVQLHLPVPFAPGREEVILSLWFSCSSAKHLPCRSCKFLAPQFSWLGRLSLLFQVGNSCSMVG